MPPVLSRFLAAGRTQTMALPLASRLCSAPNARWTPVPLQEAKFVTPCLCLQVY